MIKEKRIKEKLQDRFRSTLENPAFAICKCGANIVSANKCCNGFFLVTSLVVLHHFYTTGALSLMEVYEAL